MIVTGLKNILNDTLISTNNRNMSSFITVGKVMSADETSNKCTVWHKNRMGEMQATEDMVVDLRNGDQWFPNEGDVVLIDVTQMPGVILHQYTDNYAADVRAKKKLEKDVLMDNTVSTYGGSIL
jgi:hypothetical protein